MKGSRVECLKSNLSTVNYTGKLAKPLSLTLTLQPYDKFSKLMSLYQKYDYDEIVFQTYHEINYASWLKCNVLNMIIFYSSVKYNLLTI